MARPYARFRFRHRGRPGPRVPRRYPEIARAETHANAHSIRWPSMRMGKPHRAVPVMCRPGSQGPASRARLSACRRWRPPAAEPAALAKVRLRRLKELRARHLDSASVSPLASTMNDDLWLPIFLGARGFRRPAIAIAPEWVQQSRLIFTQSSCRLDLSLSRCLRGQFWHFG